MSYWPNDQQFKLPIKHHLTTAVLFADVSGFTRMTEELSKLGESGGEQMAYSLNRYFEHVGQVIRGSGGDIFKFAGDAILVIWPLDGVSEISAKKAAAPEAARPQTAKNRDHRSSDFAYETTTDALDDNLTFQQSINNIVRAIDCALDIQDKFRNFQIYDNIQVQVKLGIGFGDCTIVHLGTSHDELVDTEKENKQRYEALQYSSFGDGILQAFEAEKFCNPGDVVICEAAWTALKSSTQSRYRSQLISQAKSVYKGWKFRHLQSQNKIIEKMVALTDYSSKDSKIKNDSDSTSYEEKPAMQRIKMYVPTTVLRSVENTKWIDENRDACIVFINVALKLADLCQEYENKALNLLQSIVQFVQTNTYRFGGYLNKFSFDDKGTSFLLVFGLPPNTNYDDCQRAVLCAITIYNHLQSNFQRHVNTINGLISNRENNQPNNFQGLHRQFSESFSDSYDYAPGQNHDQLSRLSMTSAYQTSAIDNMPSGMDNFGCAIGIAKGDIWCGLIGSYTNREYGVLGDAVNLAARLMQSAQIGSFGKIFCSEKVVFACKLAANLYFNFDSTFEVKGKKEPIKVYVPSKRNHNDTYQIQNSHFESHSKTILSNSDHIYDDIYVKDVVNKVLIGIDNNRGTVQLIEGSKGSGKDLILSRIQSMFQKRNTVHTLFATNVAHDTHKYTLWRMILLGLLEKELRIFVHSREFLYVFTKLIQTFENKRKRQRRHAQRWSVALPNYAKNSRQQSTMSKASLILTESGSSNRLSHRASMTQISQRSSYHISHDGSIEHSQSSKTDSRINPAEFGSNPNERDTCRNTLSISTSHNGSQINRRSSTSLLSSSIRESMNLDARLTGIQKPLESYGLVEKLPILNGVLYKQFEETVFSYNASDHEKFDALVELVSILMEECTQYFPLVILISNLQFQNDEDSFLTSAICSLIEQKNLTNLHIIFTATPIENPVYKTNYDLSMQFLHALRQDETLCYKVRNLTEDDTSKLLCTYFGIKSVNSKIATYVMNKCNGLCGLTFSFLSEISKHITIVRDKISSQKIEAIVKWHQASVHNYHYDTDCDENATTVVDLKIPSTIKVHFLQLLDALSTAELLVLKTASVVAKGSAVLSLGFSTQILLKALENDESVNTSSILLTLNDLETKGFVQILHENETYQQSKSYRTFNLSNGIRYRFVCGLLLDSVYAMMLYNQKAKIHSNLHKYFEKLLKNYEKLNQNNNENGKQYQSHDSLSPESRDSSPVITRQTEEAVNRSSVFTVKLMEEGCASIDDDHDDTDRKGDKQASHPLARAKSNESMEVFFQPEIQQQEKEKGRRHSLLQSLKSTKFQPVSNSANEIAEIKFLIQRHCFLANFHDAKRQFESHKKQRNTSFNETFTKRARRLSMEMKLFAKKSIAIFLNDHDHDDQGSQDSQLSLESKSAKLKIKSINKLSSNDTQTEIIEHDSPVPDLTDTVKPKFSFCNGCHNIRGILIIYFIRAENLPVPTKSKTLKTYLSVESNSSLIQIEEPIDIRFKKQPLNNRTRLIRGTSPTIDQYVAYQVKNSETTVELKLFKKYKNIKFQKDRLVGKSTLILNRIYSDLVTQSRQSSWQNHSCVWLTKTLRFELVANESKKNVQENVFVASPHVIARIAFLDVDTTHANSNATNDAEVAREFTDSRAVYQDDSVYTTGDIEKSYQSIN